MSIPAARHSGKGMRRVTIVALFRGVLMACLQPSGLHIAGLRIVRRVGINPLTLTLNPPTPNNKFSNDTFIWR